MTNKTNIRKRGPSADDREVGRRFRIRRLELGLSQTVVGDKLGITFQQIQKYENGTNRIGAGRLHAVAKLLKVPVGYFFGEDAGHSKETVSTFALIDTAYSLRLVKAFTRLKSKPIQKATVEFIEQLADKLDADDD